MCGTNECGDRAEPAWWRPPGGGMRTDLAILSLSRHTGRFSNIFFTLVGFYSRDATAVS